MSIETKSGAVFCPGPRVLAETIDLDYTPGLTDGSGYNYYTAWNSDPYTQIHFRMTPRTPFIYIELINLSSGTILSSSVLLTFTAELNPSSAGIKAWGSFDNATASSFDCLHINRVLTNQGIPSKSVNLELRIISLTPVEQGIQTLTFSMGSTDGSSTTFTAMWQTWPGLLLLRPVGEEEYQPN